MGHTHTEANAVITVVAKRGKACEFFWYVGFIEGVPVTQKNGTKKKSEV